MIYVVIMERLFLLAALHVIEIYHSAFNNGICKALVFQLSVEVFPQSEDNFNATPIAVWKRFITRWLTKVSSRYNKLLYLL